MAVVTGEWVQLTNRLIVKDGAWSICKIVQIPCTVSSSQTLLLVSHEYHASSYPWTFVCAIPPMWYTPAPSCCV